MEIGEIEDNRGRFFCYYGAITKEPSPCYFCIRSSSLEYILNVYSLSRLNTGLIIALLSGANLRVDHRDRSRNLAEASIMDL